MTVGNVMSLWDGIMKWLRIYKKFKKLLTNKIKYVIIIIVNELGVITMKTIRTNDFNVLKVKECQACGDVLINSVTINGINYNIYLGYCGHYNYYAVKK